VKFGAVSQAHIIHCILQISGRSWEIAKFRGYISIVEGSATFQAASRPQLSQAQRAILCRKCGKPVEGGIVEGSGASRRDALISGVTFTAAMVTAKPNEAASAEEADALEIPLNQQCLECLGGGVVNCALPCNLRRCAVYARDKGCLAQLGLLDQSTWCSRCSKCAFRGVIVEEFHPSDVPLSLEHARCQGVRFVPMVRCAGQPWTCACCSCCSEVWSMADQPTVTPLCQYPPRVCFASAVTIQQGGKKAHVRTIGCQLCS
jgi:hypothetical protein